MFFHVVKSGAFLSVFLSKKLKLQLCYSRVYVQCYPGKIFFIWVCEFLSMIFNICVAWHWWNFCCTQTSFSTEIVNQVKVENVVQKWCTVLSCVHILSQTCVYSQNELQISHLSIICPIKNRPFETSQWLLWFRRKFNDFEKGSIYNFLSKSDYFKMECGPLFDLKLTNFYPGCV